MTRVATLGLAMALAAFFSGCIMPSEKKAMQGDIFNMQTRLLSIEQNVTETKNETKNTGESANKRIAATKADMDKLSSDIQKLRGDIDALRVGVVTGQLPGTDPEKEGSVAATLNAINTRLESVEANQEDLLDSLKKAGLGKKGGSAAKPAADTAKKKPSGGVEELQAAYDDKKYKQVSEDAMKLIKEAKGPDRDTARFLLAESLFKLGKMRDAALRYNELVEGKPAAKYLPVSKMRIGDCFKNLGDVATASLYYEELIKEFPKSDEAGKAKEKLAELKGGVKDKG